MVDPTSFMWVKVNSVIQMVNGAAVCILAIAQFVKQSLQMYRVTRQWELSRYMGLLVKQGIFYFLAVFMFCLINILASLGTLSIKTTMASGLDVPPAICAHVHPNPSIHHRHSGVARA
ncbi:hypothetical protein HD554DRAFT_1070249 [Boletus coccyginus]|nr:hypothetical protein HD554DRAFT_1070249 [Boletus coccyginus]